MRSSLLALLLVGCASAPPELYQAKAATDSRITYRYYVAKDYRYVPRGTQQEGNCAVFAQTYYLELIQRGQPAEVQACVLRNGTGHAYTVSGEWALDVRHKYPVKINEVGCQ